MRGLTAIDRVGPIVAARRFDAKTNQNFVKYMLPTIEPGRKKGEKKISRDQSNE